MLTDRTEQVCDGSGECPAMTHIHGCYRDRTELEAALGSEVRLDPALSVMERAKQVLTLAVIANAARAHLACTEITDDDALIEQAIADARTV